MMTSSTATPPITTLPVHPLPHPAPALYRRVSPSPALHFLNSHRATLIALGSDGVEALDATTVDARFRGGKQAAVMAELLRDTVDGVKLLKTSLFPGLVEPVTINDVVEALNSSRFDGLVGASAFSFHSGIPTPGTARPGLNTLVLNATQPAIDALKPLVREKVLGFDVEFAPPVTPSAR